MATRCWIDSSSSLFLILPVDHVFTQQSLVSLALSKSHFLVCFRWPPTNISVRDDESLVPRWAPIYVFFVWLFKFNEEFASRLKLMYPWHSLLGSTTTWTVLRGSFLLSLLFFMTFFFLCCICFSCSCFVLYFSSVVLLHFFFLCWIATSSQEEEEVQHLYNNNNRPFAQQYRPPYRDSLFQLTSICRLTLKIILQGSALWTVGVCISVYCLLELQVLRPTFQVHSPWLQPCLAIFAD